MSVGMGRKYLHHRTQAAEESNTEVIASKHKPTFRINRDPADYTRQNNAKEEIVSEPRSTPSVIAWLNSARCRRAVSASGAAWRTPPNLSAQPAHETRGRMSETALLNRKAIQLVPIVGLNIRASRIDHGLVNTCGQRRPASDRRYLHYVVRSGFLRGSLQRN